MPDERNQSKYLQDRVQILHHSESPLSNESEYNLLYDQETILDQAAEQAVVDLTISSRSSNSSEVSTHALSSSDKCELSSQDEEGGFKQVAQDLSSSDLHPSINSELSSSEEQKEASYESPKICHPLIKVNSQATM